MASAAETTLFRSRRRRRFWGHTLRAAIPYSLILPVLVVIGVILGYPLYWLVRLSTERYGLFELIRHAGVSVGFDNFSSVLRDPVFWHTLLRTVVFTAANVSLTMGVGMLLALLLVRVITLDAGLAQVPRDLVEAAEVDGARPWRVFLDLTLPILRPILLILTSLSIIWDFGVFTQPYLLIGQSKITTGNYLMSVYLFEEGYFKSDFGRGAAISILMLLIVAVLSVVYVRKMVRIGEAQ